MRVHTFGRGVAFAVAAAFFAVTAIVVAAPLFGTRDTLLMTLTATALAWLFVIAPTAATGFRVALVAGVLAALGLMVVPHVPIATVGLTLLVGLARGVFLQQRPAARAMVVELAVGVGALLLASQFVPGGLTGLALAVWSFWLVQSLTLMPSTAEARRSTTATDDAFSVACDRAEKLLAGG